MFATTQTHFTLPDEPLMRINEIEQVLPHRAPMLLVEYVWALDPESIITSTSFTGDEWFFKGHFPDNPLLPGNILLEIMAQAGAIFLLKQEGNENKIPLNIAISGEFPAQVTPADVVYVQVFPEVSDGKNQVGQAHAYVNDSLVSIARLECRLMRKRRR